MYLQNVGFMRFLCFQQQHEYIFYIVYILYICYIFYIFYIFHYFNFFLAGGIYG
jgi:hypothetical protein